MRSFGNTSQGLVNTLQSLAIATTGSAISYLFMRVSGLQGISDLFTSNWGFSSFSAFFYVLLTAGCFVRLKLRKARDSVTLSLLIGAAFGLFSAWVTFATLACFKTGPGAFVGELLSTGGQYGLLVVLVGFAPLFGWLAGGLCFFAATLISRLFTDRQGAELPRPT